jgi:hypothetical protein
MGMKCSRFTRSKMQGLLESLKTARWRTAFHTLGNSHNTLVGLVVDWWINAGPIGGRWVLEAPPRFVEGRAGDAILYEGTTPRGAVEVQADYNKGECVNKLDHLEALLGSVKEYLRSLNFGILLAYATDWPFPPPFDELVEHARAITLKQPTKQLAVLTLEKTYQDYIIIPDAKSSYYSGRPTRVRGALLMDGTVIESGLLAEPG